MTIRQYERKTKSFVWCDMIDLKGFKNELQQILPPNLSISDVQTSNKYITTNRIVDTFIG